MKMSNKKGLRSVMFSVALAGFALIGGCGLPPEDYVGTEELVCQKGSQVGAPIVVGYVLGNSGLLLSDVASRTIVVTEESGASSANTQNFAANAGKSLGTKQLKDSVLPCSVGRLTIKTFVTLTNDRGEAQGSESYDYRADLEHPATAVQLKLTMVQK